MRYLFPDHWTFLLGEIALYCFLVLVGTGIFLAMFYDPSAQQGIWHGPYAPLDGTAVSGAYGSVLDLSFRVPGGLLIRQTHHWAALVFIVAIALHLLRIFYTAAYRRPRELNYLVGLTLLGLALVEGFAGYSLLDDLLSGMGLAIGNGVALSIPGLGGPAGALIWDGQFPGGPAFFPRLYAVHIFLMPALLGVLIAVHLLLIVRVRHSQFRGPGRTEGNVVGSPLWPGYALRSVGMLLATAGVLLLLGGLVQINPVWQWGPYEPWIGENGAQPDWYLGWLIGALRLMPNWEIRIAGATVVPNPFFGGLLFPGAVFGTLYAWPWLEQRFLARDTSRHDLLDRPRDNPRRTAFATAFLTMILTVFAFGASDRLFLALGITYTFQLWLFRVLFFVAPVLAGAIAHRICVELRAREAHPLRGVSGQVVRRNAAGGFEPVD
jgi:ubiquinol-cytochrome c reductase cytochrome b subunit